MKELAQEYNVTTRTIQKDFKERLDGFSIEKSNDYRYRAPLRIQANKPLTEKTVK